MATYSLTAETGGFGWYHSWLLKTGFWDDDGWWADVAAWEANEGINFNISDAVNTGVFTFLGVPANKSYSKRLGTGLFSLAGQDVIEQKAEAGNFSVVGQDAKFPSDRRAKSISINAPTRVNVLGSRNSATIHKQNSATVHNYNRVA